MASNWRDSGLRNARVGRAHFDPCFEAGDLSGGEFFVLGRHPQLIVGVTDRLDQKASSDVAGLDGGAGIAALEHSRPAYPEAGRL